MNANSLKIKTYTLSSKASRFGASSITTVHSNIIIGGSVDETSSKFVPIIIRTKEN